MAKNPEETRAQRIASVLSATAAATGYVQTDYANNTFLIIDVLGVGTNHTVALSTGSATGAVGSNVSVNSATSVVVTATGTNVYHLNDKLAKYTYCSVTPSGAGTIDVFLVTQGYPNTNDVTATGTPTEG